MPKEKTHKGLAKRVRVTARGKIKRGKAGGRHLLSVKNAKRRRRIRTATLMVGALAKTAKRELLA